MSTISSAQGTHGAVDNVTLLKKIKMAARKRVRFSFDCNLSSPDEKEALQARLDSVRQLLFPIPSLPVSNSMLLQAMLDAVEEKFVSHTTNMPADDLDQPSSTKPFLRDSGE